MAIKQVIDWYIETLGNTTIENNIISMQIALETLSYVVLVEQNKILTDEEFDREVSLLEKALSDTGYRTEYCVWRLIDEDKFNYINTDSDISRAFPRGSRSDDLYNKRYDSDMN